MIDRDAEQPEEKKLKNAWPGRGRTRIVSSERNFDRGIGAIQA